MASSMTRPGGPLPTPRSSAAVAGYPELAELHEDRARLRTEVARLERHVSMLSTEVARADQKVGDLENLLLATRRLDACADRAAVLAALQDILVTVVGANDFVVLALDEEGRTMWPILGVGTNGAACGPLLVSDALVSAALETGKCQLSGPRGVGDLPRIDPVATIPLLAWPHTVGALVVFTLPPQRSALRPIDVELLEFLSSRAASAIQLADLRASDSRRPPSLL
jgi:GAF domain-containing protein